MRAFIAVDFTKELIKKIDQITNYLKTQTPQSPIKWVPSENLHLTIKFLGNVPDDKLDIVKKIFSEAVDKINAFNITIKGLGMFPNQNYPRVIWLGVNADTEIFDLYRALNQSLQQVDVPPEKREYSPHLTIGRLRRGTDRDQARKIGDILSQYKVDTLGTNTIDKVCLYQSNLTPQGPIYTPLMKVPLIKV